MTRSNEFQVIWSPQPGPQTDLVRCPVFEVFYGGARGGGKTDGSIGDWISHSAKYGENAVGLFVRRKLTQLSEVIARTKQIFYKLDAKWNEQKKEWTMPNGARLRFAYLERDSDAENYQGHNYTRIYVEEATNFPFPDPIMKLKGALRSANKVPCGMRLTGNPGGPGHHWVRERYIESSSKDLAEHLRPDPKGYKIITEEEEVEISPGEFILSSIDRVFIPAKLKDNQELLRNDPGYVQRLRQTGSAQLVRAWLEGDWNGVDGTFFSEFDPERHIITGPLEIPRHWTRFRSLDWGSAAPFSVGWYTVSDGSLSQFARGALIKLGEWYGWNGKPNVGLKMSAATVAQGIIRRDADFGKIAYGVADPSIFATNGGPSIAEMMIVEKAAFIRGDNARQAGWEQMRKRFAAPRPLLLFHESCEHTIRTLPYLQHDEKNPEDLDTDGEDHAVDETRYACMSRPITRDLLPAEGLKLNIQTSRALPTINELIAKQQARDYARSHRY